jgi:hypothetical protein
VTFEGRNRKGKSLFVLLLASVVIGRAPEDKRAAIPRGTRKGTAVPRESLVRRAHTSSPDVGLAFQASGDGRHQAVRPPLLSQLENSLFQKDFLPINFICAADSSRATFLFYFYAGEGDAGERAAVNVPRA